MTAWKMGDVANVNCSDGEWRRAVCVPTSQLTGVVDTGTLAWLFADGARWRVDESAANPLLVLDPYDDQQAAELCKAVVEACYAHNNFRVSDAARDWEHVSAVSVLSDGVQ